MPLDLRVSHRAGLITMETSDPALCDDGSIRANNSNRASSIAFGGTAVTADTRLGCSLCIRLI